MDRANGVTRVLTRYHPYALFPQRHHGPPSAVRARSVRRDPIDTITHARLGYLSRLYARDVDVTSSGKVRGLSRT
jgi:hypothetical protein